MTALQKSIIVIGSFLTVATSILESIGHLPVFLIVASIVLIAYGCMNVWWVLDLRPQNAETRSKSLFYVVNYPNTLWAFVRYLRQRNNSKVSTTSYTQQRKSSNDE